ncbi:antibiotic biosynthesis monooxygenase family protein [Actinomadura roseirufa]|uniref:antibiotic biosynthesis monooxygenase family protein n=1 Tax=Actinomadura roseirufa TaxID=2094049 RepID=UPI0010419E72|nr:antibiotic biosynthesis monooxygenase family protein [Actinomadura roseirufa]
MADETRIFRVMLRMNIKPGMEREFEETWHSVGHAITEDPANIRQWLSREDGEEGVYHVVSDWVDEPGFRLFERSDKHLEHRTKLHPYRSSATMATMQVVFEMTGKATAEPRPSVTAG